jgi:hypothetical protein
MFAELINHRFWLADLEVYFKAAQRISQGMKLYRYVEDGHYIFKYSPTSAIYFIPLIILDFEIAKVIYWLLLTFLIVLGFIKCIKLLEPSLLNDARKKQFNWIVIGVIFSLAIHFLRELHLGQVNYLLFFIYLSAVSDYLNGKKYYPYLIAISLFLKPFALIFIPYLLLKKEFKGIALISVGIVALAILPLFFYGSIDTTLQQYVAWMNELKIELSHKQGLLQNSNHTIFSVVARYTPLQLIVESPTAAKVYQLILLSLLGLFVFSFIRLQQKATITSDRKLLIALDFAMLISLIPLLAFTSENAFIYTMFLVFVIIIYFNRMLLAEKIVAVIGLLFIGGNFAEVIGKKLSQRLDEISLISVGAIILLFLIYKLRKRGVFYSDLEK